MRGYPLYTYSAWMTAGVIATFLILCAFNYGRLTATSVTLRSSCDLDTADRNGLKPDWYLTGSR